MSGLETNLPAFPWHRPCPYRPPMEYERARAEHKPIRIKLATGQEAWLITSYDQVRAVLNDRRLSSDRSHPGYPYFIPVPEQFKTNASFLGMDPPEHDVHRRMITKEFTYRRVQQMRPRVQQVVDDCLTAMLAAGPPTDLVQALSLPVPTAVIGELLGVPYQDHELFHERTKLMMGGDRSAEERMAGLIELEEYLRKLIFAKEREPGDDLLSRLVMRYAEAGMLDYDQLTSLARLLLIAGHETSANMISLGTLTLLHHPDQLAELKRDPGLALNASDELLRYLAVADLATSRIAMTDIEIGGVTVRAGEGIIALSLAANRDATAFDDPDRLDLHRDASQHVAFGYGLHHCIGADLTRLELEVVFGALFQRVPGLRLAKPMDQLPYKDGAVMYGVYEMPVTW
jgi:cytochrome P450